MNFSFVPDEETLHAFVDGRLETEERRRVESFLARSPEWAGRVAGWKRDAERLRSGCAAPSMPSNPRLDPATLRREMRARSRRRLATAAMLVITAGLGGVVGWDARDRSFAAANPPMADAVHAYRVFATARSGAVEVSAGGDGTIGTWLSSHLGGSVGRVPDLGTYGFRLVGGRELATDGGPAAMLLFEDAGGRRIAYYMRPGPPFATETMEERRDGGLLARYWSRNGYRFAVVAPAEDARAAEIARVLKVNG